MMDDETKSRMNFFSLILWRRSIARIRFQVGRANGSTIEARKVGGDALGGPIVISGHSAGLSDSGYFMKTRIFL